MELLILENENRKASLVSAMKQNLINHSGDDDPEVGGLLGILLGCAKNNAGRQAPGNRYPETLKELGMLLYTIGGYQNYEILSANIPLPSVSRVRYRLHSKELTKEGVFRFGRLSEFLTKRKSPRFLWCGEDGTKVVERIQYCCKTNQVVGFVPPLDSNGLPPVVCNFPATFAKVMKSYFQSCKPSSIPYCFMAQPISDDCPTFCLGLFGTDNRFNALHCIKIWKWMHAQAKENDMEILGCSADGDGKLLRAMLCMSVQKTPPNPKWEWFTCTLKPDLIFIQDVIHQTKNKIV